MKRLFVLCLFAILLVGCASEIKQPEQPPQEPVVEAPTEPSEPDEPLMSAEECATSLEDIIKQSYDGCEVKLSDDKTSIMVALWQDGLAAECYKASKGIEPYASAWKDIVNSMQDLSVNVQSYVDETGHTEISAAVVVRNDQNMDAVLLMTNKGRVLLDAVGG